MVKYLLRSNASLSLVFCPVFHEMHWIRLLLFSDPRIGVIEFLVRYKLCEGMRFVDVEVFL